MGIVPKTLPLLLLLACLSGPLSASDWYGWTTVQGSNVDISGGVDAGWRKGDDSFIEKGYVFYRVRNRYNERVSITILITCQGSDGPVMSTYSGELAPGQVDDSKGNWAVANEVTQYNVTAIDFPDRDAQQQQQQQQQLQQQQQQQQAQADRQQQLQEQQNAAQERSQQLRQQRQEQQEARRSANEEWRREHDEKVQAAQERIESIRNATAERNNAIDTAADQLIAIVQEHEQEREAQRDIDQLEEEEQEHQQEQEQAERELDAPQQELDNSAAPVVASLDTRPAPIPDDAPPPLLPKRRKLSTPNLTSLLNDVFASLRANRPDPIPDRNVAEVVPGQPQSASALDKLVDELPGAPPEPAGGIIADCRSGVALDAVFAEDAKASGDKCTCWASGAYKVQKAMSNALYQDATVSAYVGDDNGLADSAGGNMFIRNLSALHNVYYGLSGVINAKLAPGQARRDALTFSQTNGNPQTVVLDLDVRFCKE